MKKLFFAILCFAALSVAAQEFPIYSPVRIFGTLALDPLTGLPTGSPLLICNFNDTVWIYESGWKPLWPNETVINVGNGLSILDETIILDGNVDKDPDSWGYPHAYINLYDEDYAEISIGNANAYVFIENSDATSGAISIVNNKGGASNSINMGDSFGLSRGNSEIYLTDTATIENTPEYVLQHSPGGPKTFVINPDSIELRLIMTDSVMGVKFNKATGDIYFYKVNDSGDTTIKKSVFAETITEITYSEIITLMYYNGLEPGMFYKITDQGDRWLLFQAVDTSRLATDGQRLMLCPADYFTHLDAYNNNWIGIWHSSKSASINDLAIWGGLVWKNLTGAIGSATSDVQLDETNWVLIPKTSFANHEYTEMIFGCRFDWENGRVVKQWDTKGNVFTNDPFQSVNYCDISDWNYATSSCYFYENKCWGVFNNISGSIYKNSGGPVYDNFTDVYNINDNRTRDGIYENALTGSIDNNFVRIINSNSCGNISYNRNLGGIYNNSNSGVIENNCNNGDIQNNSNLGSISHNANNGSIFSVSSGSTSVSVYNNINNGYITGVETSNVFDTAVNK